MPGDGTMPRMQLPLKLLTLCGRAWLRLHGVRMGSGGWIHGLPSLRMKEGSSIQIGREVTLNSLSRYNPLAPRIPVTFVTYTPAARISIGDHAGISNSVISCSDRIEIGAESMIGADCLIVDCDFHGLPLGLPKPPKMAPIVIGNRVFVGTRAIILKGVTIGEGCVIAAGSVVVKDIPPHSLAGGNPAKVIRRFAS